MKLTRQALVTGSAVWAAGGAVVALSQVPHANSDARWLAGFASVVFPGAAVAAAVALHRGALRLAGNAACNWAGAGCKPTPSGWPGQHEAWLGQPYPEHRYATPGTYTVTVTAVSAGCAGQDEQTASARFAYRW